MRIAPSILDADWSNLQTEIDSIKTADRVHLDVMDNHYVPNLSFGASVFKNIDFNKVETEAHLMVNEPEKFFADFIKIGIKGITFHIENTGKTKALELLKKLKNQGIKAGICIDGYTDENFLSDEILATADQILVMSVKSGFGGQKFMEKSLEKIKKIRERGFAKEIEIDGGVNDQNISLIKSAGVDIAVVGSFLMKKEAKSREKIIRKLQKV